MRMSARKRKMTRHDSKMGPSGFAVGKSMRYEGLKATPAATQTPLPISRPFDLPAFPSAFDQTIGISYPDGWLPHCHFCAILQAMKATLDAAGRIVVPKALRQALGLKPGQPLEIRAGDGRLEIEIAPTPMQLKKRGKGVVAVPDAELPALTAEQVRDTLERVRR